RAAPGAEEQQDHQRRQARGDGALGEHALDGGLDEDGLVEEELDLQLRRHLRLDARHGLADAADDVQGGGALALQDGHEHGAAAVAADDVGLDGVAVADVGDVLDVDGHAVDALDRDAVEGGDDVGAAVDADVVLDVADLGGAGGDDQVLVADGGADVAGGEPLRVQRLQGGIDHYLAPLAAPRVGHPRPPHRGPPPGDEDGAGDRNLAAP